MVTPFTTKSIKESACGHLNGHLDSSLKSSKSVKLKKPHPQKEFIQLTLENVCAGKMAAVKTEFVFAKPRRWRFDWAIEELKIAVEYEGIYSKKSRHTTKQGYTNDTEKYNAAAKLGWTVLRYTAKNYKNIIIDLFVQPNS